MLADWKWEKQRDFTYNVEHFVAVDCDAVGQVDAFDAIAKQTVFISIIQSTTEDSERYMARINETPSKSGFRRIWFKHTSICMDPSIMTIG